MTPKPSGGVLAASPRPSSGSLVGERRAARDRLANRRPPPWRSWRTRSRAARAIRFVETYCRIPSGARAGELLKLHRYQKESLEALLAPGVRTGGLQIPRGNAKSTTWAAVGLWAVADSPDSPQVPLIAFNGLQAARTLFRPIRRMIGANPELEERLVVYNATSDRRVWSAWNDGELLPLPADVDRLQGLNPTVALIDESQTLGSAVLHSVMQGAGKRAESLVLSIGTPAPDAMTSALAELRAQAAEFGKIPFLEFAADEGCAIDDRKQWRKANPAIGAGLLFEDVLELELTTVSEAEFRMYRLGQWVDAVLVGWLPAGSWEELPTVEAPPEDTDVVLGLAGTYTSTFALVGATFDGTIFTAWIPPGPVTEAELEDVLSAAFDRWRVSELVVQARILTNLVRRLEDAGLPVRPWIASTEAESSSSTELRRAIVDGRLAHDHDPVLAAHIGATVGTSTPDGALRLVEPDDGRPASGARAARMAWSRAAELGEATLPRIY